jgi:hypothetical protein
LVRFSKLSRTEKYVLKQLEEGQQLLLGAVLPVGDQALVSHVFHYKQVAQKNVLRLRRLQLLPVAQWLRAVGS